MRIAFLSDIHANAAALRAALAAVTAEGVDRVIVAGDIVGDGPLPAETVRMLMSRDGVSAIRGNIDRKVIRLFEKKRGKLEKRSESGGRRARNRAWTALALGEEERAWLAGLPTQISFPVEGFEVLVVHGSPLGDDDYVYPSLTDQGLARKFEPISGPRPDLLVTGHSHIPFARDVGGTFVVNCGSVGNPIDGDPRGSFAIAELVRGSRIRVDVYRFAYPVEELEVVIEEGKAPEVRLESYLEGVST